MAGGIPADRNPEFIAWLFPLLGTDDRENMTRIWQMMMPPEVFGTAIQLVHQAIGGGWMELSRGASVGVGHLGSPGQTRQSGRELAKNLR